MIHFAYKAIVHMYEHEGKMLHEIFYTEHIVDNATYDGSEDMSLMDDYLTFPKEEGFYSVWVVGTVSYHTDYFGEVDVAYDFDVERWTPETEKVAMYFVDGTHPLEQEEPMIQFSTNQEQQ